MSSAFLCATCGIDNSAIGNQAAYIASWTKAIKDDSSIIVQAAGAAQKAANYILGIKPENQAQESENND
jgi:antirestriction protein ArdC